MLLSHLLSPTKFIMSSVFVIIALDRMLEESIVDGDYIRWALAAFAPLLFCVSLVRPLSSDVACPDVFSEQFFTQTLVNCVVHAYVCSKRNACSR